MEKAEEEVLGPDEAVVEEAGLLLGIDQDPAGTVGEALEHRLKRFTREVGPPGVTAAAWLTRPPASIGPRARTTATIWRTAPSATTS